MRHFCTYFDSAYIWKGLALYESMRNVCDEFCLHIMALDEKAYNFLKKHESASLTVDNLKDIETEELLKLKQERTRAEYCWTCGPVIILYIIEKYQLADITYLDSDLMFLSSFNPIYDEIGNGSIAITPQYSNRDELAGKYCVQFMFFRNDENGISCLKWWKDECIKWCYARYEDGKFGDQKYLDSFPVLFKNVVVIKQRGAGVAPWNMNLYTFQDRQVIYNNKSYPLIFYHFHGIRMEVQEDTLIFQLLDCDFNKQYDILFFKPYMKLVSANLVKYFHKDIHQYVIRERSLFSKLWSSVKSQLKGIGIIQRLYFKYHKHEGWEQSKL